jgi:hypothetical protein
MTFINKLSRMDKVEANDLFMIWSTVNGDTRASTAEILSEYIRETITPGDIDQTLAVLAALGLENDKLVIGTGSDTAQLIDPSDLEVTATGDMAPDTLANWFRTIIDGLDAKVTAAGGDASAVVVTATGSITDRTLAARFGEVFNVRDYGVTGDGITDDTAAIAAASAAAGAGGALFFPPGIYVISDHDSDGRALMQLTGQRWFGAGDSSVLLLSASSTSITVVIDTENFAENICIENMCIDGNRGNITPASDLYSTFYLLWGPRGGSGVTYRNLTLRNSWGRVLQTGKEGFSEYTEDVLVDGVRVLNAGTKAISVTKSRRATVKGCFAQVDPYTSADHPGGVGDGNAGSGSCFECNRSEDVEIFGNHGIQLGASVLAPGIRLVNSNHRCRVFGNTIEAASYLGFIQNADDVEFFSNTGLDIRGNAILVSDSDADEGAQTCKRIRVHNNTIVDPTAAYVFITANKSGLDAFVECYIHDNDFIKTSGGSPTHGIFNRGVIAPATGGECLVYQWNNNFSGSIPNQLAGEAVALIRPRPDQGWQIVAQSGVSVSHTGNTSETTVATIAIPAYRMGANGRLRVTAHYSYPNNANNKITRTRFGGLQMVATTNTTTLQQRVQCEIANRNSHASQIVSVPGVAAGFGNSTSAVLTQAVNTASNQNITLTVQLGDAADTIVLESYVVELFYAA